MFEILIICIFFIVGISAFKMFDAKVRHNTILLDIEKKIEKYEARQKEKEGE